MDLKHSQGSWAQNILADWRENNFLSCLSHAAEEVLWFVRWFQFFFFVQDLPSTECHECYLTELASALSK